MLFLVPFRAKFHLDRCSICRCLARNMNECFRAKHLGVFITDLFHQLTDGFRIVRSPDASLCPDADPSPDTVFGPLYLSEVDAYRKQITGHVWRPWAGSLLEAPTDSQML